MAHYAFLDDNNIVTEVITGRDEDEVVDGISDWEAYYGEIRGQRCVRTSYNTGRNEHANGGTPFRGNFAGIGYEYREDLDAFIGPSPYPSWVLDETTFTWEPPVPDMPGQYLWDEEAQQWVRGPQPFPSWVWNENTAEWEAPTPYPANATRLMIWNEETQSWELTDGA